MTYIQIGLDGSQAKIHACPHCEYSTPSIIEYSMHLREKHWPSRNALGSKLRNGRHDEEPMNSPAT